MAEPKLIRVLIADDRALLRGGVANIINQEADMTVVAEAGTGLAAVKLYREHVSDVALIDLSMREMDGVEAVTHFANGDENMQQSDDEIVLAALDGTPDEKLTGLALRLVLSDHIGIPHENQPDLLTEAEQVFAPKKPKVVKAKSDASSKPKPGTVKASAKKQTAKKKAA